MDTVSFRVPSKLIRDFSYFSVSKAVRSNPSARCSTVGNNTNHYMDVLVLFHCMIYCVMLFSLLLCFYSFIVRFIFTPVPLCNRLL
jgi:hypothetical protein